MPKVTRVDDLRIADMVDEEGVVVFEVDSGTKTLLFSYSIKRYWEFMEKARRKLAPHVPDKVVPLRRH
jgi:hypothetical protein